MITTDNPEDNGYIISAVSQDGDFIMAYTPYGRKFSIKTNKIKSGKVKAWWFNPRDGKSMAIGEFSNNGEREFISPNPGEDVDWILVLDDSSKNYPAPGGIRWSVN